MKNNNDINDTNLTEGIYIANIEACWLYKLNEEKGDYEIKDEFLNKLLNGKLDYSFELVENKDLLERIEIKKTENKLYTLDVVNVKFSKKYKKLVDKKVVEEKTTKELRNWAYTEGFNFDSKLLTNWKRSSGKSRVGEDLFIIDNIKDTCLAWSRMNLKFEGKVDIGSIRAYESLPLSSIIGCIEINPLHILVIDDFESKFMWNMSKTYLVGKSLETKTDNIEECNSIWDGQGLLSEKIFSANELIQGKGVALLRNRYMKCAGFCCRMELFFRNYCAKNGLDYDTYEIEDMYHNMIKVSDIELVTTPSAIKLHKYNDIVIKETELIGKGAWLQYWLDNCGTTFGVCKTEKKSHYADGKNVLSYQMVNTIPFLPDELKTLVAPEKIYIERLKNDLDFFLQEVNQENDELDESNELIDDDENEVEVGSNIDVTGAFIELSMSNKDFQATQVFKDYRRNYISAYISKLRQGRIRVESDYCVACGNPYEMLLATLGEFDGVTSVLNDNELYCSRFTVEGETIIGFRNPHLNYKNIGIQKLKICSKIQEYMNDTPNIVYLNSIKYPILSTYQGEDYDIDCNLLSNDTTIVTACERIDIEANAIPVNGIENTGKNDGYLTAENMCNVDVKIAENFIGSTINLSQELNSKMNDAKFNNTLTEKEINGLYDFTSRCSSISQCEIDKSKKQFQDLEVPQELDIMKKCIELVDNKDITEIDKAIYNLRIKLAEKKLEIREYRKAKRKPVNKKMKIIKKELEKAMTLELQDTISTLEADIVFINLERQNEIDDIKAKITIKSKKFKQFDSRRIKPYFFKYIGDTKSRKQRKKANKSHRKELNLITTTQFALDNDIKVEEIDKKNIRLVKLIKDNEKIQSAWEAKAFDKEMDTPMNWLNLELDTIKNGKNHGTMQVIQLMKKSKHSANKDSVNYIVKNIKYLDTKITGYRLNDDLTGKEKVEKIRSAKDEVLKNLRFMKLNKTDLYGVMKACLNTCKKNGKVNKTTGIESLSLELLFKAYGTSLLGMFVK